MLDWTKGILGDNYSEAIEKAIETEIGKHFIPRTDFNAVNEAKKGLEGQLDEASKTIEGMKASAGNAEKIAEDAAAWEKKYREDTEALKQQLEQTKYTHGIEALAGRESFSSEAARKSFVSDLAEKKLPFENGKLVGYEDFKKAYLDSDPGAFAEEAEPPPVYATGTGTTPLLGGNGFGLRDTQKNLNTHRIIK